VICSRSSCAAAPLRGAVGSIKVRACGDINKRAESSIVIEIAILFGEYFILMNTLFSLQTIVVLLAY
ncbi:MAG: hypothetical protein M3278_05110, partial [Thermoproteota archaeon]|nr:hypothetical protein [Thermoproteota archaeon]